MRSIITLSILATLLVLVCVFVYYCIYAHNINTKIRSGQIRGRRLIDIPRILIIAAIVLLILYSVIITKAMKQNQIIMEENFKNRNNFVEIDPRDYTYLSYMGNVGQPDASFARVYSKEYNAGYRKNEFRNNGFLFTVFTRSGVHNEFSPDFICFVDYQREMKEDWSDYQMIEFRDMEEDRAANAFGNGGGQARKEYLYLGNLNEDCKAKIRIGFLDPEAEDAYMLADQKAYEADKDEFPSAMDFANVSASVEIVVD